MNIITWIFKKYKIESKLNNLEYTNDKQKQEIEQHEHWQKGYLEHISELEKENKLLKTENKRLWKNNTDLILKYLDLYVKQKTK